MANFTDSRINQTYQRLVQVVGAVIQDGLGNTLSGSMGDLTISGSLNISGHPNVSASISSNNQQLTTVSSSLALETAQLLDFSASLDATFATDAELGTVSSSLALETAQLLDFSASLDATFATDAELTDAVSDLNAQTSSFAIKTAVSGAFEFTSASFASRIAGLDSEYATDAQLTSLSSSAASTYATDTDLNDLSGSVSLTYFNARGKIIISSSVQLFAICDPRYGFDPYDARYANSGSFTELSASLQSDYVLSSSFATLSSSLDSDFLSETEWQIASASLRNDINYDFDRITAIENKTLISSSTQIFAISDPRYGFTPYDARYAKIENISGSFAIEAAKITELQTTVSASALLNLTPSDPLPTNVGTGSLAITGSTLALYDGNNWKVISTGSTLPL